MGLSDEFVEEEGGQGEETADDGHQPRHDNPNIGEKVHVRMMTDGTDRIYGDLPPFHP